MAKTIKTTLTEQEFRQIIREEVQQAINAIPGMPKVEVSEGFLGVDQAAELLKLKKGTVYGLVHYNKIPYSKTGRRVLFKKSELLEWLRLGNPSE